jgi:hypothetical protein
MREQIADQDSTKLVNKTVSEVAEERRIERTAEKAATKSMKTGQRYDEDHTISSK